MTDSEARARARDLVMQYGDTDCTPVIDDCDVDAIVARRQLASTWLAGQAYNIGDVIQPTVRTGSWYICTVGGISSATEPFWSRHSGWHTSDGNDLRWQECGPDRNGQIFDWRGACHDVWMLKAAKASALVTQSVGSSKIDASALHEQCRARAQDFISFEFSVSTTP